MDDFQSIDSGLVDNFAVRGDLDVATLYSLPRSFRSWLRGRPGSPPRPTGLDLGQVTFLDCAGLQGLLAIERHAELIGGGVTLTATSPAVTRLLDLVALPAGSAFLTRPRPRTGSRTGGSGFSRAART